MEELIYGCATKDLPDESTCSDMWLKTLRRCYGGATLKGGKRTVAKEWLLFSNFKKWFDKNYTEGYVLSVNIISTENTEYSPDKCLFIPNELQVLIDKKITHNRAKGSMYKRAALNYPEFAEYLNKQQA